MQYTFTYEEQTVKVAPRGNSVKSESYIRTMASILNNLKDSSSSNTAKCTLSLVASNVTTAHSAAAMPCGRQQVNDINRKMTPAVDPLFTLMMMCKGRRKFQIAILICSNCNWCTFFHDDVSI